MLSAKARQWCQDQVNPDRGRESPLRREWVSLAVFAWIGSPGGSRFGVRWKLFRDRVDADDWLAMQKRTVGGIHVGYVVTLGGDSDPMDAIGGRIGSPRVWGDVDRTNADPPGLATVLREVEEAAQAGYTGPTPADDPDALIDAVFARADQLLTAWSLAGDEDPDRVKASYHDQTPPADEPNWSLPEDPNLVMTAAEPAQGKTLRDALATVEYFRSPEGRRYGAGVTVAVLDTGCDTGHAWFTGQKVKRVSVIPGGGSGADGNGHGTWCCGCIVGSEPGGGDDTFQGYAPRSGVLSIQVMNAQGWGTDDWFAAGFRLARESGCHIVSISAGGPSPMPKTAREIEACLQDGMVIVAAAGNEGPSRNTVGYPGAYGGVVTVGACTVAPDVRVASFSSRGPSLDVIAPGVNLWGPAPGNRASRISGTSMACPGVAGGIADLMGDMPAPATGPDDRAVQAAAALVGTAANPGGRYGDRETAGMGLISLTEAWRELGETPPPPPPPPPGGENVRIVIDREDWRSIDYAAVLLTTVADAVKAGKKVLLDPAV